MFLLTSTLIFISAVLECHAEQKLVCPYGSQKNDLQRVWCKRDANDQNCCTGFSFQSGNRELDGGRLRVQDDGQAFTVIVRSLSLGDGVYWCGLKNGSETIIKLAEGQIYNSMDLVWSILRWLLFGLLLLSVVSVHVCCSKKKVKK